MSSSFGLFKSSAIAGVVPNGGSAFKVAAPARAGALVGINPARLSNVERDLPEGEIGKFGIG